MKSINNIRLGAFVLGGLLFLVLLLYMIGRNSNLFGDTYELRARFRNIQGLVAGNNVRYAGIETGTVKKIEILNDTVIEVTMIVETKMKTIIRKNAMVSIGTEGVVGNKVINIFPSGPPGPFAEEQDLLATEWSADTDEMLNTLQETNQDVALITGELKSTIQRINNSSVLWTLLNDNSYPYHLSASLSNIHLATDKTVDLVQNLNKMVMDVSNGKGSLGKMLRDTSFAQNLNSVLGKMETVGNKTDTLAGNINQIMEGIRYDIHYGNGPVHALLKDSVAVLRIRSSLDNIQQGTEHFNQNMEALKHSFLLRGYFKNQERKAKKAEEKSGLPVTISTNGK